MISDLIRQTFADPRGAAQRIIGMELPIATLWQALALVIVLSVIAAQVTAMLLAPAGMAPDMGAEAMGPGFGISPLTLGLLQGAILILMVFCVHWIGRALGGTGRLEDAVALVAWLQFLLVCLQVVQAFLGLAIPGLSALVGLAGLVVFFWLLTQFVMVLHGFGSAGMVFVMIVVSLLAVTFALSILLSILGVAFLGEVQDVGRGTGARRLTDPRARGEREAAGLSRQRRLSPEARSGDRGGGGCLASRLRQCAPRPSHPG